MLRKQSSNVAALCPERYIYIPNALLLLSAGGAVDGSKVQAKRSKPQLETFQEATRYNELIYCSKSVLNTKHGCLHISLQDLKSSIDSYSIPSLPHSRILLT